MDNGYDYVYLSLGAGVQSSALLVLSNLGLRHCPQAAAAIFADTGFEPPWVYQHLEILKKWSKIPIHVVQNGNLHKDILNATFRGKRQRFVAIPAYTSDSVGKESPLRRQCTREYKVDAIEKKLKELIGVAKGGRVKIKVGALIGMSVDEVGRVRPNPKKWIENLYPLVDNGITREGCKNLLREVGLPIPGKSACIGCPYHDDAYWHDLKSNHPQEWRQAVEFDKAIRDMTASGIERPVFLHRSLVPLAMVELNPKKKVEALGLFDSFGDECEGLCGV